MLSLLAEGDILFPDAWDDLNKGLVSLAQYHDLILFKEAATGCLSRNIQYDLACSSEGPGSHIAYKKVPFSFVCLGYSFICIRREEKNTSLSVLQEDGLPLYIMCLDGVCRGCVCGCEISLFSATCGHWEKGKLSVFLSAFHSCEILGSCHTVVKTWFCEFWNCSFIFM